MLTNQAAIGELLALAQQQLGRLAAALAEGDETALRATLEQIARQRNSLYR